jgi:hypothetical protein
MQEFLPVQALAQKPQFALSVLASTQTLLHRLSAVLSQVQPPEPQ